MLFNEHRSTRGRIRNEEMASFCDSAFTFSSDSNFLVEPPVKKPRHTHSKWQDSFFFGNIQFVVVTFLFGRGGVHEVKRHCSMQ